MPYPTEACRWVARGNAWVLILLHISTLLPVTTRLETKFLRLLERFSRSASYMRAADAAVGWLRRWVHVYHRHEILTIRPQRESRTPD